jgi:hypothetical protein
VISEDLRQRVLTALASELEHDEAERRRDSGGNGTGAGPASSTASLATGSGVSPANGSSANPGNGTSVSLDSGRGAAEDAAMAQEPEGTAERAAAGDAAVGPGAAGSRPAVPLPRRAPGANGAPPPPAELRRDYLPPSVLGRKLDPEAHTEPLPRISATGRGTGGPAATGSGQSAQSLFSPTPPATAPPGASAEPAPPGTAPAEAVPSGTVPPESVPPPSAPSAAALAAVAAPTMPAGSAALAAAAEPTMPAGSAALAAASVLAPPAAPAGPAQTAPDVAAPPGSPTAPAAQAGPAAPAPVAPPPPAPPVLPPPVLPPPVLPPPVPAPPRSPAAPRSPAPSGYGWTADPGGARPGSGRGGGTAAPPPAALPAAKRPPRSGRPYRIAGVILAVVALVAAAVIALVLSGRTTAGHGTGQGSHARGAGAVVRERAAAWVAGQVSQAAVVACDPVMCQALKANGVLAHRLYPLGAQTTSPLRSQIIVATAAVRAQFGNVLSSVYAPAVLASFGFGPGRIDIRETAPHGAAAYWAMLGADLANRKASGAQLLHSGRIAAGALARRELTAGQIDGRLLLAIAQMAATHPMFIVDFGRPAPGAGPDMPLRQADLAEDAHAHRHADHVVSAGYVRSMVSFLHAQHGQFRAARVQTVRLPDGAAVLRVEFTAPSPLGLLGPHA